VSVVFLKITAVTDYLSVGEKRVSEVTQVMLLFHGREGKFL